MFFNVNFKNQNILVMKIEEIVQRHNHIGWSDFNFGKRH